MISTAPHCDVCRRRTVVSYRVEPEEAWKTVVLNRWRNVCPSCFDVAAEKASVKYTFTNLDGRSLHDCPPPRNPYKRKR